MCACACACACVRACFPQAHQSEMESFDENLAHISTWLYQTQIHMDEVEKMPPALKEREVQVTAVCVFVCVRVCVSQSVNLYVCMFICVSVSLSVSTAVWIYTFR